jgi:hypothetical protein
VSAPKAAAKHKGSGKTIRSMSIEPHGKEGFVVTHHHESPARGEYIEPETHMMKTHGEVMNHVHDHMASQGSSKEVEGERPCPFCQPATAPEDEHE